MQGVAWGGRRRISAGGFAGCGSEGMWVWFRARRTCVEARRAAGPLVALRGEGRQGQVLPERVKPLPLTLLWVLGRTPCVHSYHSCGVHWLDAVKDKE